MRVGDAYATEFARNLGDRTVEDNASRFLKPGECALVIARRDETWLRRLLGYRWMRKPSSCLAVRDRPDVVVVAYDLIAPWHVERARSNGFGQEVPA